MFIATLIPETSLTSKVKYQFGQNKCIVESFQKLVLPKMNVA